MFASAITAGKAFCATRDTAADRMIAGVESLLKMEPLGDSAIIVRVGDARPSAADALPQLLRIRRQLERAAIPGVREVTTAYTTVAVFYDPVAVYEHAAGTGSAFDWLKEQIVAVVNRPLPSDTKAKLPARAVEIPVCYHAEFALDLAELAEHAQLSADEVVRLHSSGEYRVQCVGFTPGFPYLAGLPPALAKPRRTVPRAHVPAGSVAIGGSQTGVYPLSSPGGWNVIGRTPLELFSATREQPALLKAGDRVRFRPISTEEFHTLLSPLQSAANK